MNYLALIVILSAVTYRVGRFIVLDTLIDGTRDKVYSWLERQAAPKEPKVRPRLFWVKLLELLGCPWCITIWIAAFATFFTDLNTSVPMPVWTWLAASTGGLVFWAIIDSED